MSLKEVVNFKDTDTMQRKEIYLVKKVGERYYLRSNECVEQEENIMFAMNETCKFIWDLLDVEQTESYIVEIVSKEYCVEKNIVKEDVKSILNVMLEAGVISIKNKF